MKVKDLIKELKKLPKDLEVGVSMGDNSEGEIAGWVCSVWEEEILEYNNVQEEFNSGWTGPKKPSGKYAVVLRC